MSSLRANFVWMDGALVPWDEANVHIMTHTLHYGLGMFEGIRCYQRADGRSHIFRHREHILRPTTVGKALPEIDRAGGTRARRHGFENRCRQRGIKRVHHGNWRNFPRPVNPPPSRSAAGGAIRLP